MADEKGHQPKVARLSVGKMLGAKQVTSDIIRCAAPCQSRYDQMSAAKGPVQIPESLAFTPATSLSRQQTAPMLSATTTDVIRRWDSESFSLCSLTEVTRSFS